MISALHFDKKRKFAFAIALLAGSISGCSDNNDEKKIESSTPMSAEERKRQEVFNPTPEQKAKQKEEAEKREELNKPFAVVFPNPGYDGDISKYISIDEGMTPFKIYIAQKNWEEDPQDTAESAILYMKYEGMDKQLNDLHNKWKSAEDAFEKRDLAKAVVARAENISAPYKDTRLVKITLDQRNVHNGFPAYDISAKRYDFNFGLFSDKTSYTDDEKRNINTGGSASGPLKSYLYMIPFDYKFGFSTGAPLRFVEVPEEQARKSEKARAKNELSLVIYGYIERVQRDRSMGKLDKDREILIAAQRIDLVDEKSKEIYASKLIQQ